jgi:hypothetical protein
MASAQWHNCHDAMNVNRNYQTILAVTSLFSLVAIGAVVGCSSDPTSSGGGSCTGEFSSIREDIFLKSCTQTSCHGADQPAAQLDLTRADLESALINVPAALCNGTLVVPGDPANSLLFQKLNNPACGVRMPLAGALSADQINCVSQWISGLPAGTGGNGGNGSGGGGSGGNGSGGGSPCETCGGATCVDVQSDPNHCGKCNTACGATMVCNMGMCAGGCGTLMQCGGSCVDATSDANNCGACGKQCAIGQSCTDGQCTCGTSSVSFSGAIQPILTANCTSAGCHGGIMPQAGLNLTNGKSYMDLVNVNATQCTDGRKLILPGDPGASYLVDKITNVDICFGTKMPKLGSLPPAQIQSIVDWICQGAPDN